MINIVKVYKIRSKIFEQFFEFFFCLKITNNISCLRYFVESHCFCIIHILYKIFIFKNIFFIFHTKNFYFMPRIFEQFFGQKKHALSAASQIPIFVDQYNFHKKLSNYSLLTNPRKYGILYSESPMEKITL